MKTCCPECKTILTLNQQQLAQRDGMVRCGICRQVFNAVEHLYDEDYPVLLEEDIPLAQEATLAVLPTVEHKPLSVARETGVSARDVSPVTSPTVHIHLNNGTQHTLRDKYHHDDNTPYIGEYDDKQSLREDDEFIVRGDIYEPEIDQHEERTSSFAWLWFWLILVALVLIVGQLFYVFRNQISTVYPSMRPVLMQMCSLFKCEVGIQKSVDNIALVNVVLSLNDKETPQQGVQAFHLQALLVNKADKPQDWPVLVLRLKNAQGAVVSSKNIQPKTYLIPEQAVQQFAGHAKQIINLPFTLEGEPIRGYELSVFYP